MPFHYLIEKKHLFKNRSQKKNYKTFKLRIGTSGLFTLKSDRFELVYLRGFKKLIRKKFVRKGIRFKRYKFWLFLKPNVILSNKSVNSRMGSGVGSLVRISIKLRAYVSFVEFLNYSPRWLPKIYPITRYKYPLKFTSVYKSNVNVVIAK